MNLKVADFGFATFKKINQLKSYRGTMTYMAPEIKEGKPYDGRQVDLFSTAVILFIVVQGIFPFKEAKKNEFWTGRAVLPRVHQKHIGKQTSSYF